MDDLDDEALLAAVEQTEAMQKAPLPIVLSCYTDGCCLGNGQAGSYGGYGYCVCSSPKFDEKKIIKQEYYGSTDATTNNRMEMTAVLKALLWVLQHHAIYRRQIVMHVHSDSEYTLKYISQVDAWIKKGWKTAAGTDVLNQDLWLELQKANNQCRDQGIKIIFVKVTAHLPTTDPNYDPGNAYADDLANEWSVVHVPGAAARRKAAKARATAKAAAKAKSLAAKAKS